MKHIHNKLDLKNRPETYKTILKDKYGFNTETSKIRRKMSKAIKSGFICSKPIENLNNGRDNIFYKIDKEYFIVYTTLSCFYCCNISSVDDKILLENSYELNCVNWVHRGNLFLNTKEVVICF